VHTSPVSFGIPEEMGRQGGLGINDTPRIQVQFLATLSPLRGLPHWTARREHDRPPRDGPGEHCACPL